MGWLRDLIGSDAPYRPEMMKAAVSRPGPQAWNWNPTEFASSISGVAESYSHMHPGTLGLDYATLMASSRIAVIGAIIQTRVQQVAEFAIPQKSPYSSGFRIQMKDPRKTPTKAARRLSRDLQKMITDAGDSFGIGGFEPFIRAIMRDSFTYDQANFELFRSRGAIHSVNGKKVRKILGFVPVDAASIRRAKPTLKEAKSGQIAMSKHDAAFVQIVDDRVRNEWSQEEMAWCIRRPRTWLSVAGYGFPELEELMKVITDLLNAQTYNSVNFTNGIHASTILAVKSTMDEEIFDGFRRNVRAMMHGVHNAKRMPMVQLNPEHSEEIQAVSLSQSNKDMEYSEWINWLLKVTCACYSMDPAEIGFVYGNENQSASMNSQSPESRIVASKERGLRPVLRAVESWINRYIIDQLEPDFEFVFSGIDVLTESEQVELDSKAVRSFKTINEVRQEHDLDPLDNPLADMVLDGTYISSAVNLWQQQQAQEQQEQMMQQQAEAGGDEEGGEGGMGGMPTGGGAEDEQGLAAEDLDGIDLSDMGAVTEALASGTEKAIRDGRVRMPRGAMKRKDGRRLKYFRKGPSERAYILEFD